MNKDQMGGFKTIATLHKTRVSEAGTLEAYLKRVEILPDLGAIAVAMPPAAIAPGQIMHIFVPDVDTAAAGATTAVTLSGVKGGNLTLDADGDTVVVFSDGVEWVILRNAIA